MNLPELFKNYLKIQKVSAVTAKNYLADINQFLQWLAQKTGIKHQIAGKAIFGLFTVETIKEYKTDQLLQHIPLSTINRRLSALRKFGQFGKERGWITDNPASKIANLHLQGEQKTPEVSLSTSGVKSSTPEEILRNFQKHLEKERVSQITIKNYLSDLRHFLGWLGKT